ncbi:MAG: hypothetical protein M3O99_05735 [Chloroflexota bacterium]|nr:hypothetical protein [Chloroflexota bacterium]
MTKRMWAHATIVGMLLAVLTLAPGGPEAAAVELQPTTTIYLPNIVKMLGGADGWNTPFIVQNVGAAATDVTFEFYRFADGGLVRTRTVTALAPGTSVFDSPNHDEELAPDGQYSVVIKSFGSQIVAVVNEHQHEADPLRQEALSYDGLTSGSTKLYLPRVAAVALGWYCTVITQNLGTSFAAVVADFKSFDGTKTAQLTRAVPPRGSKFIDPRFETSLTAGTEYSVVMTSTQPIGVVVNCHSESPRGSRSYSYDGVLASSEVTAFGPYVATNVNQRSRILVQNQGTTAAHPIMYLYPLGSWSSVTIDGPAALQPGAVWEYDASSAPGLEAERTVVVQGGQFALLVEILGASNVMAYTGNTEWATRIYLPNITKTLGGPTGWTTPFVLQSQGAFVATVRWYRMSDGVLVYTQKPVFGLLLRRSGYKIDPRSFPQLADNTQYAVVIESSSGGVGAVVLETNERGGDSAMAYEAMTPAPTAAFGASNCTPAAAGAGSGVRCRMYGFPAGASPVALTIQRTGSTTTNQTVTDEPIASDGSWDVTVSSANAGLTTVTVAAGGVTRTATFTTSAPTFSVQITQSTNGALVARTKPGATCIAWAYLPNQTYSQADNLWLANSADASGVVRWDYPLDSVAGTGEQVVRCAFDGETHQDFRAYSLP